MKRAKVGKYSKHERCRRVEKQAIIHTIVHAREHFTAIRYLTREKQSRQQVK